VKNLYRAFFVNFYHQKNGAENSNNTDDKWDLMVSGRVPGGFFWSEKWLNFDCVKL